MKIVEVKTKPFAEQKAGTSGLRKKVSVYKQKDYLENYIQCIFDGLGNEYKGKTLVIGGDGRYFSKDALQIIVKMAIANGWGKIIVGENGLLSTPAVSHIIMKYEAFLGILLTASHNPGGIDGDFGVKTNSQNGSPALESQTNKIYELTQKIKSYKTIEMDDIDISTVGEITIEGVDIQIISSTKDYIELMQSIFDFDLIRKLFEKGYTMRFDAMNAVTGPYAHKIFEDILGAAKGSVVNGEPLEDFGGLHPDPNPVYAKTLVDFMMGPNATDFAAACDGDGDRNMILGKGICVSPNDSVAVLAAHHWMIPAFKKGLKGVARSMPTTRALDRVAKSMGIPCYETPTGWKFFGNLMDAGKVSICAEESYGTGANHVREKDGIWAVLYWLNVVADKHRSIGDIMTFHWSKFGRNYYMRHDYEGIETKDADKLIENLRKNLKDLPGQEFGNYTIMEADDFSYTDPIDNSVSKNQGIRIVFDDDSRIIMRLSGTGTEGATLRVYFEKYESNPAKHHVPVPETMLDFVPVAERIAEIKKYTKKDAPDVIVA